MQLSRFERGTSPMWRAAMGQPVHFMPKLFPCRFNRSKAKDQSNSEVRARSRLVIDISLHGGVAIRAKPNRKSLMRSKVAESCHSNLDDQVCIISP